MLCDTFHFRFFFIFNNIGDSDFFFCRNAPLSMYDAEIDGVALGCVIHLHYYTAVGFPAFLFLKRDQKMVEFAQSSYRVHPRAVCCVPMFVPGKLHNPAVFGVVIVANREPGVNAVFSVVDEAMLRMFGRGVASQLAASIEQEANNEKITRLLKLDDLTQILAAASSHRYHDRKLRCVSHYCLCLGAGTSLLH